MRSLRILQMFSVGVFLVTRVCLIAAQSASPVKPHVIAEYPVPPNGELGALVTGPDGNVWVAGYDQISKITPAGHVTTYPAQANGLSINIGPDGALWFGAATSLGQLGRMTTDGTATYAPIPPPSGATFVPEVAGVVTGPDGNLWLTDYSNGEIIRYALNGTIAYFPIPGGGLPYGIVTGPDGNLWAADRQPQVEKISTAGQITVFGLPGFYGTESIAVGGDGNLWVNNANGGLGRVTTTGQVTAFPVAPVGGSAADVQFVTTGPDGTIWFNAWYAYPYEYVGVMNTNGKSQLIPTPTSGSGAYALTLGPGGRSVWFTEAFANQVGVAVQ